MITEIDRRLSRCLIAPELLVRNRLGPYNLVLKSYMTGMFLGVSNMWFLSVNDAWDYIDWGTDFCKKIFKEARQYESNVYLTTSAGLIRLTEKDFKKGWLTE